MKKIKNFQEKLENICGQPPVDVIRQENKDEYKTSITDIMAGLSDTAKEIRNTIARSCS
jgi:hypothetical protein